MADWHDWNDFLHILSTRHNLAETEAKTFLIRFARDNLDKTDEAIAEQMGVDFGAYRKAKKRVYKKFSQSCLEINHDRGRKFQDLLNWLEENYHEWLGERIGEESSSPSPNLAIIPSHTSNPETNPFIPLNGVIDKPELFFSRQREIQNIFNLLTFILI